MVPTYPVTPPYQQADSARTDWGLYALLLALLAAFIMAGVVIARRPSPALAIPASGAGASFLHAPPATPATAALAKLVLPDNSQIALTGGVMILGRNDLERAVPADGLSCISRRHFTIGYEGGQFYIEDKNSTNGTRLNGVEIRGTGRHWLRNGDNINIANVIDLRFVV